MLAILRRETCWVTLAAFPRREKYGASWRQHRSAGPASDRRRRTTTRNARLKASPSVDGLLLRAEVRVASRSAQRLARTRCTDVLRESAPRLVLLAAPPGFGKTTLLAQWREVDGRAFACVSLDSGDNDPVTFWSYIVQAIRHAASLNAGAAALSALGEPRASVVDTVVPAVLRDLEAIGETLVLVLDDYQEITNRICHDSLGFFLERTPSNVTLALSTRSDPPIQMARLRALEELLELRAVDLSFTEAESAAFLNQILHLGLATETLGVLHERTEGWPVGVHLAAMSLAQRAGSPRLRRALWRRQPSHRRLPDRGRSRHARRGATPVPARDLGSRQRCRALSATQPPGGRAPPRCWSSSSEPTSS